jgi:hypothetical protein
MGNNSMVFIKRGSCDSKNLFIEQDSERFDHPLGPEQEVTFSGIYRCLCGVEVLRHKNEKLPGYNDHECVLGNIEWKLLVSIDNVPKTFKLKPRN